MSNDLTTLRFEVQSPDRGYGIHLDEQVKVEMHGPSWYVSHPSGHASWHGHGISKMEAILDYLHTRLGMKEP